VAYHKATPTSDWPKRAIDYRNIDSLKYVYSIASPKLPGNKFTTHTDLVTTSYPSFTTGDWHRLSNGGSRDSVLERYLAVVDDATVAVATADGLVRRQVTKGSIVLAEALSDGTWLVSVPITGEPIDDVMDDASTTA
jgi:hypothetical protein